MSASAPRMPKRELQLVPQQDPYSEFRRLAKNFRARQSLAHQSSTSRKLQDKCCSGHVLLKSARLTASERANKNFLQDSQLHRALSPRKRARNVGEHDIGSMCSSIGDSSETHLACYSRRQARHGGQQSQTSDYESNYYRDYHPKRQSSDRNKGKGATRKNRGRNSLGANLEGAMMKVFAGNGVSTQAIRDLYRKRFERKCEEMAALNEVRQWWGFDRSRMTGAAAAANFSGAQPSCSSENGAADDDTRGNPISTLTRNLFIPDNDELELRDDAWFITPVTPTGTLGGIKPRKGPEMRQHDSAADADVVFDHLKWREILSDDLYRTDLVRSIKQVLKTGQKVKLRALEDTSCELDNARKDCKLMLNMLYMQLVQVIAQETIQ